MTVEALGYQFSEQELTAGLAVGEVLFGLNVLAKLMADDRDLATYHLCLLHEGSGGEVFQNSLAQLERLAGGTS